MLVAEIASASWLVGSTWEMAYCAMAETESMLLRQVAAGREGLSLLSVVCVCVCGE